MIDTLPGCGC